MSIYDDPKAVADILEFAIGSAESVDASSCAVSLAVLKAAVRHLRTQSDGQPADG